MFRLGTRPDSARMSSPDESSTSSASPLIVLTEIGTDLASSDTRCAVTVTLCSLPTSAADAASAGAAAWACVALPANASAMDSDRGLIEDPRSERERAGR